MEEDICIIREYLNNMERPTAKLRRYDFDHSSYAVWAVEEILALCIEETFKPPPCVGGPTSTDAIDIIESFVSLASANTSTWVNEKIGIIVDEALSDLKTYILARRRR